MYSLIEQLKRNQQLTQAQVKLLYWVKHRNEAAFASKFEQLASQYPQFEYKIFSTQDVQHDDRLNVTHLAAIENLEFITV
ncbi:ferredoxin reductase, partial [Acinetobacter gyllenbergii]